MPKLPDISDLGPTPTADPTRPVGSYDVSGFYRGAAAITEAGKQFGAGVQQAGEGYGELSLDESRWDYAKAHASLISGVATQNAATAQDTNIGPDDSGQTLTERHAAAVQGQQDSAADLIRDPRMRERFVSDTAPLITESNLRADAHARALDNSNSVAYVGQQGDAFINQAIAAPDDATRTGLIDAHNQLVDGLVAKGAYTPLEGQQAKQAWAHQYATADALHRADTDPQGVINELRAAPGSNDAITNRILQVEGPGKAATSSAVGGMTDGTWLSLIKQNRPDLAQGQSDQSLLAMRADKGLLRDMTEANRAGNESYLKAKGLDATPGAQYLAHFLGPAGATAVLQAPPGTPVKDALSQAVGPDKAQQMIDANKSVLDGQLSGSVKQWADTKMGGAVPGGGSIYDMLRPDVREEVLAHAEASLQKQNVADRADFEMRRSNAEAEALDTGAPPKPLTPSDFIGEYGAERGPVEFAKYDTQVQTGRAIQGMATMTPQERDATVSSLAPQPGDANYALKAHAYAVAQHARANLELQAAKDPAGFAASSLPASKDAYAAFTQAVTNPAAAPADRAAAAQSFAGRTLMEQERFGLPEDARRVVPESYVDGLNKTISAAANSDDPQKRVGLIGQIQQEASMWGQFWPQVMRQLAPESQPIVRAAAVHADPDALTRLLSLQPKETAKTILGEQNTSTLKEVNDAVIAQLAPLRGTMMPRQLDIDLPGWQDLTTKLTALYVRDGDGAPAAAEKAYNKLIGNRYTITDGFRVPNSAGVAMPDVQAGALAARDQLQQLGARPPIDTMPGRTDPAAVDLRAAGRNGRWVTAPDNSGLSFVYDGHYGPVTLERNDGQDLVLPWDKLAQVGRDYRAAQPSRREYLARHGIEAPGSAATAPQDIGVLGSSLVGPLALTQRMGEHADMDKFERTARPSTNVEDDRNRPKSFKEKLDNAIDSATDDVTTGLFK